MPTVLVLDDDPVVVELLRTVLTDEGHACIAFPSLDAVTGPARADLAVVDLVPLKSYRRDAALAWVASLRERLGGIPMIVLTAHAAALAEPDRLGADGIVGKPFDVDTLLATVNELLR